MLHQLSLVLLSLSGSSFFRLAYSVEIAKAAASTSHCLVVFGRFFLS